MNPKKLKIYPIKYKQPIPNCLGYMQGIVYIQAETLEDAKAKAVEGRVGIEVV